MKKRIYVLDTSVLLTDFKSLFSFKHHDIVIPLIVLDEIDKNKSRQGPVGKHARTVCRILDSLRLKARKTKTNLAEGVQIRKGFGKLFTKDFDASFLPSGYSSVIPDHQILATALTQQSLYPERKVIVVANDTNLRIKCDSVQVLSDDFVPQRVIVEKDELFNGHIEIESTSEEINALFDGNLILPKNLSQVLHPNQFLTLKSNTKDNHTALARFNAKDEPLQVVKKGNVNVKAGVKPKNREQIFAWNLLMDENIPVVSLLGKAGTGKTLLALAAGLEQLNQRYTHLIVSRPIQPMGRDIGFLPGTLEEKMTPWLAPVEDNLRFLFGNDREMLEDYMDRGIIEIEALTYIRGRSIGKAYIVIDECQNLTRHEIKTILTRVGHGSKIILTGDIEQIDNVNIDETSNGLSYVIEKFKEVDLAGHMTLIKGERSPIATISSELL